MRTAVMHRPGFSLLETILALVILVGALAVVGQMIDLAVRSAAEAQQLTEATRLCESKMAEVLTGLEPFQANSAEAMEDHPGWEWSLQVEPAAIDGLLRATVTVRESEEEVNPASFSLTRWLRDPALLTEQLVQQEELEANTQP